MDQSCSGRVFRLIMFLVFLGLAVFITLLLVASKATYQRGVFNKFSVFIGVVAGLDFLFLVVFGWRLSSKQNFLELVIALVILLVFIPVVGKLFGQIKRMKANGHSGYKMQ
ncbi:Uncharacterised protein [Corynebacterium kutscheri]|nr:Uncharacterised protein [Corynebacterium kutscheri]